MITDNDKPVAAEDVLWTKTGPRGVWRIIALGQAAVLLLDVQGADTVEVGTGTKGALRILADTIDEAPATLAPHEKQLADAGMRRSSMPWREYQRKVQGKRRAQITLQTAFATCSLHSVSASGATSDLDFAVGGETWLAKKCDLSAAFADIDMTDAATAAALRVIDVKLARDGVPYAQSL